MRYRLSPMDTQFDVIVIGGGHAGCEAAVEAMKHQDDLVVYSLQELHAKLH